MEPILQLAIRRTSRHPTISGTAGAGRCSGCGVAFPIHLPPEVSVCLIGTETAPGNEVTAAARQDLPDLSGRHGAWQTNVRLVRSRNAM